LRWCGWAPPWPIKSRNHALLPYRRAPGRRKKNARVRGRRKEEKSDDENDNTALRFLDRYIDGDPFRPDAQNFTSHITKLPPHTGRGAATWLGAVTTAPTGSAAGGGIFTAANTQISVTGCTISDNVARGGDNAPNNGGNGGCRAAPPSEADRKGCHSWSDYRLGSGVLAGE